MFIPKTLLVTMLCLSSGTLHLATQSDDRPVVLSLSRTAYIVPK